MATIRRASPHDAAGLACLAERTFRDTFTAGNNPADMGLHCSASFGAEIQLREIENPSYVTILGEEDGELVAFAQVRLRSPKECVPAKRPSELFRLYVLNQWHGGGIAHEVMNEVLAEAALAASDRIWLGVWEQNARALAFYRKFGFEIVGVHMFLFGNDLQRDLVMALEVNGSKS